MERRQAAPERRNPNRYDSDRRGEHEYPPDENQRTEDRRGKVDRDELRKRMEQIRGRFSQ